ncbi:MAG: metallophosphoesterase family protein [Polyangiales bacterium]
MIEVRRVGVIGDVHTERARLQGVLARFRTLGLDRILCVGDIADGPGTAADVDACCELLREHEVLTVSGNHDRWLQDNEMRDLPGANSRDEVDEGTLAFLAAFPATASLQSPAGEILLCHGLGADDLANVQPFDHGLALEQNEALQSLLRETRYRYVINGHTHRPMVRTIDSLTVINAGSLHRDYGPCCLVADFERKQVCFYDVTQDGSLGRAIESAL